MSPEVHAFRIRRHALKPSWVFATCSHCGWNSGAWMPWSDAHGLWLGNHGLTPTNDPSRPDPRVVTVESNRQEIA